MKKSKSLVALLLAAAMFAVLLTGCGEKPEDPMTTEMNVTAAEGFDADYTNCLKNVRSQGTSSIRTCFIVLF